MGSHKDTGHEDANREHAASPDEHADTPLDPETTRDDSAALGVPADVSESVPETATGTFETGTVPAFLGWFKSDEQAIAEMPASDAAVSGDTSPVEVPADTDSIRIFSEMFRGFRRGAAAAADAAAAHNHDSDKNSAGENDSNDGTDDEADAELVDDVDNDEATGSIVIPAASTASMTSTTSEENDVSNDNSSTGTPAHTIKTTYVPSDASNKTEQALAWLAAENVASGQAPAIGTAVSIVPRRRRWVGAVIAPFVVAIVLAVAYVVSFAVWPLSNVAPTATNAEISTPVAPPADLPWPAVGQAAILIGDDPTPLRSGDPNIAEEPTPTASLAKVITVMTILNKQPLAPGEDGPSYEFGWADKQAYDAMLWSGESALPVPVDGTLTYRQMLEGIMLSSAGNYVNKLVDTLWEYNRDAFRVDAQQWMQDNGISNTNIVGPTGISPSNQSTATNLVKVAKIAMENPAFAEIVGEKSVTLPGAGLIENSNPLLGEYGVIGVKTGHLDTWSDVDYNLMTAADVAIEGSDDPVRVYTVVMGQDRPTEEVPFGQQSRELLQAITDALQPVEAMAAGTVVGTVTAPWGASTNVIAADTAMLTLWNSEEADVKVDYDVDLGDTSGSEVGTVTLTSTYGSAVVPLTTTKDLPRPTLQWRLTHPLELLGFGK